MLLKMSIDVMRKLGIIAGMDPIHGRMVATGANCDAAGVPRIGALAALADAVAGVHAISERVGELPLTADLTVRSSGCAVAPDAIVVGRSRLVKARRTAAVLQVEMVDESTGRIVGDGVATFTYVQDSQGPAQYRPPDPHVGAWPPVDLLRDATEPLGSRLGRLGVEIDIDANTKNDVDVLSGGALAMLADLAANHEATRCLGRDARVHELGIWFLAPGRVGPAAARCEHAAVFDGHASLRFDVVDCGADDRHIALVTAGACVTTGDAR